MANVYNTIYKGDFCDKSGNDIFIEFKQRMDALDPIPTIIPIVFAGEGDQPVVVEYPDKGDYKLEPVNGSTCKINIKAISTFELSSLYTADERDWLVVISGAWNWQGYLMPDSCSEPYDSKPYDVSVEATDSLGTLKDVPFLKADGTKYKGFISDLEAIRFALQKTDLALPFLVGVNTYEVQMATTDSPLRQSYINANRFIDSDGNAFSCHEVIRSIMARYSSRLIQFNGYWQIVNVLEQSTGLVPAFEYDANGILVGSATVGNAITAGGQNRNLRPVGDNSFAKAYASSTAYYQYGYGANALLNGNMDDWASNPTGLPDDWNVYNGATAHTETRLDRDGNPTGDHYIVIDSSGTTGFLGNDNPVLVRANETTTVTFDLLAQSAFSGVGTPRYLGVLIHDGAGNYFTNNNGWQPGFQFYVIQYKASDFQGQISVNFKVNARPTDFDLYFGVQSVQLSGSTDYQTKVNNVSVVPAVNSDQTKPPVGLYNKQKSLTKQTFVPDPILLLHGDDANDKRTSQISIGPAPPVVVSGNWARAGITESKTILDIVANTELRLHSRPYRIFDAEFIGYGLIDVNTLLTIDLLTGTYIFLSGSFDLKRSTHTLRFAETLINDIPLTVEIKEDYGTEKDKDGVSVGTPSGVNAPSSGSSYIDLSGYATTADIPVKASAIETAAGSNDDKFITPFKLLGWWTNILSTVINFSARPTLGGVGLATLAEVTSGGAVRDNTMALYSSPGLTAAYPGATEGFRVQCPNINVTYSKCGADWLVYTTTVL